MRGFETTGIWPFNSQVFGPEEFAPSQTTERPIEIEIINLDILGKKSNIIFILNLNITF